MNIPNNISDIKTGRLRIDNWMEKHYPEFVVELNRLYPEIPIKEQLYLYYNNLPERPVCLRCGNPVSFHGYKYGYAKFCGPTCAQLNDETRIKHINTITERYGRDYKDRIVEKVKKTKLERYGDENYNNKEKQSQTCLERYGVDNPLKSKEILEKVKQTNNKRYGCD